MNKFKKTVLMLCLVLSGVFCYTIGVAGRLKRKNQEILELKDQIRQQHNNLIKETVTASSFVEEPVCRLIMKRVTEGRFRCCRIDATSL